MSSTSQRGQFDFPVASRLLGTSLAACILASTCVAARLWFRYRISRLGADDFFILAAMVIGAYFHWVFLFLQTFTDFLLYCHDLSFKLSGVWSCPCVQSPYILSPLYVLFLRHTCLDYSYDQDFISFHASTIPPRKSLEDLPLHLACHSGNVSMCIYFDQLPEMYAASEGMEWRQHRWTLYGRAGNEEMDVGDLW